MKQTILLIAVVCCCGGAVASGDGRVPGLSTEFAVLVGFPSGEAPAAGGVVLVPGTVIPLEADGTSSHAQDAVERSLSFTRAIEKLWTTFRLDPVRRVQLGKVLRTSLEEEVAVPAPEGSGIDIMATLLGFNESVATYRVVFRQGDESLADSTVSVQRGGRAVVGGMDGEAAPYLFIFVEPDPPHGGATRWRDDAGISQPVAVTTVNPSYPEAARKGGISGVVVVETIIGVDGTVLDARILESPDLVLGDAAVEAVRQWRFEPARKDDGTALEVSFVLTIKFALR